MESSSKKMAQAADGTPILFEHRQAIRRLLIRFMEEHRPRDGSQLSAEACSNYISTNIGITITKSVIIGFIANKMTSPTFVANIRDFLLSVYTDVDPETISGSRTKQATTVLARVIQDSDSRKVAVRQNNKLPFEELLLNGVGNQSVLALALSDQKMLVMRPFNYGIFDLTADLQITNTNFSIDKRGERLDFRRFFFIGHVVRHNDELTGVLFDYDQKICVMINLYYDNSSRVTPEARLIQLGGPPTFLSRFVEFKAGLAQ